MERYDGGGRNDAPGLVRPVGYFQVANEFVYPPNPEGSWLGTTEELIQFINVSYAAVKARSPEAVFLLGGVASAWPIVLMFLEGRGDDVLPAIRRRLGKEQMAESRRKIDNPKARALIENRAYPVLSNARYDVADVHLYRQPENDPFRIEMIRKRSGGRPILSTHIPHAGLSSDAC